MKYINIINIQDYKYVRKLFLNLFEIDVFEDENGIYLIVEDEQLSSIQLLALEENLKIVISHNRDELFYLLLQSNFQSKKAMFHISEFVFYEIMQQNQTVIQALKKIFNRVEQHLIFSAKAYLFNNLNSIQSAKEIYVHRNTFNYRLQQFIEQSGVDIRDYQNSLLFYYYLQLT